MADISSWIDGAIETESKGLLMYEKAFSESKNGAAKQLFEFLIREETRHRGILEDLKSKQDSWEGVGPTISKFIEKPVTNHLFEGEKADNLKDASLSESLNAAMAFEKEGLSFYVRLSEKENDPDIKSLLKRLAADEERHNQTIQKIGFELLGLKL